MKFFKKSEYYNETQISSFMISYGFKEGLLKNKENISTNVNFIELNKMKLPISTNPSDYGKIIKIIDKNIFVIQNLKGQIIFYYKFVGYNEIEYFKDNKSLIKFRDVITSDNSFTRIFDNKNYYFKNNQQVLFTKKIKSKFISKTKTSKNIINNFITLDIETFINENSLYPYLISFYDGKNSYSFGLWDYKNVEEMILDCLSSIFIRKYNGYKIYVHNLAKFDIIFLLKYIIKLGFLQPVIHNDKIISLQVNYGGNKEYQVEFFKKDSLLILTTSLAKLCKAFNVDNSKSVFPHFFVNENNLDYIGEIPDIKYFNNISLDNYNNYKSKYLN
jgi:DNA polymerase type B, organellar and viral